MVANCIVISGDDRHLMTWIDENAFAIKIDNVAAPFREEGAAGVPTKVDTTHVSCYPVRFWMMDRDHVPHVVIGQISCPIGRRSTSRRPRSGGRRTSPRAPADVVVGREGGSVIGEPTPRFRHPERAMAPISLDP